jgi:hypothetical protein
LIRINRGLAELLTGQTFLALVRRRIIGRYVSENVRMLSRMNRHGDTDGAEVEIS